MGNFFKDIGHAIKSGTKSVGHLLSDGEKKIEKSVGTVYKDGKSVVSSVYKDGRSAVGYTGKHLVNDVDNLSSTLSSPILLIGVAIVGAVVVSKL